MYPRPNLTPLFQALLVILLLAQGSAAASSRNGREWALGGTQSPKGVGVCMDFVHERGAFHSLDLTADLIDILDGRASTPGVKLCFRHNIVFKDWEDGRYACYAGPGLMAGYVRDMNNHFGFAGGLSADLGFRFHCARGLTLAVEWQADFALQFKNRYRPNMSLYEAGYRHSYYPHVRILYRFK